MANTSTTLSSTVAQQQMPAGGRSYGSSLHEQPMPRTIKASAHSSLCACASCFPDPIA